jgi:hypothetical protein
MFVIEMCTFRVTFAANARNVANVYAIQRHLHGHLFVYMADRPHQWHTAEGRASYSNEWAVIAST